MPVLTVDSTGEECSCPSTSESPTRVTVSSALWDRLQSSAENNIHFSVPLVRWLQSAASRNTGDAANALLQVLAGQKIPSWDPSECSQKGNSFCSERIPPTHSLEMRRDVYRTGATVHPSLPGVSRPLTWACVGLMLQEILHEKQSCHIAAVKWFSWL